MVVDPKKIAKMFEETPNTHEFSSGSSFSDRPAVQRALKEIFARIADTEVLKPGDRVLDVGFGSGQVAQRMIAEFGVEYDGLSIDDAAVQEAKKIGINALHADMHDIPAVDGSYDVLWASHVLEHSPAPYLALKEWFRVLSDGGILVLWGPIGRDFKGQNDGTVVYGCNAHIVTPTEWQYKWLFEISGFEVFGEFDIPYQIANDIQEKRFARLNYWQELLRKFDLSLRPHRQPGTAFLFLCRKKVRADSELS